MSLATSAIIAILAQVPEAERLLAAIEKAAPRRMSAGNFVELGPVVEAQFGAEALRQSDAFMRCRHPAALNCGDCFAYALAKQTGEALLFKGNDFSRTDVSSVL